MQGKPIAVGDPPTGNVRGLGVCDVLEVEIAPVQLPWLIDELDEMRGPLEEQLVRERADLGSLWKSGHRGRRCGGVRAGAAPGDAGTSARSTDR